MGLVRYYAESFFEPLSRIGAPVLGQIGWIPVPNLDPQPNLIEAARIDLSSHAVANARWTSMTDEHFRRRPGKSYPILNLRLGETEELLAYKAKRRPAVVVGMRATTLGGLELPTPRHHEECRLVMAPVYGVRTEDDPTGFSPLLVMRIRHLLYRQFFPFAQWHETRTGIDGLCHLAEGVVRFDRLQFVAPRRPGLQLVPLRLSDDILPFLHAALWAYLHAPPSQTLVTMQALLRDCLPEQARPAL